MFAVTVMDQTGKGPAHLDIFKNGNRVGSIRSEETKELDSASKVVVLNLRALDVVYVKNYVNHNLCTTADYAFNTFSGILIKEQF